MNTITTVDNVSTEPGPRMSPDPGGGGSRRDVAGKAKFAIVVHGGVNGGVARKEDISASRERGEVAYNNRERESRQRC